MLPMSNALHFSRQSVWPCYCCQPQYRYSMLAVNMIFIGISLIMKFKLFSKWSQSTWTTEELTSSCVTWRPNFIRNYLNVQCAVRDAPMGRARKGVTIVLFVGHKETSFSVARAKNIGFQLLLQPLRMRLECRGLRNQPLNSSSQNSYCYVWQPYIQHCHCRQIQECRGFRSQGLQRQEYPARHGTTGSSQCSRQGSHDWRCVPNWQTYSW